MKTRLGLSGLAFTAGIACSMAEEGQKKEEIQNLSGTGGENQSFDLGKFYHSYGGQTSNGGAAGNGGTEDNCDLMGKFITYTQGGWHSHSSLIPMGQEGVTIGDIASDYATFTDKEAVVAFLPATGTPGALQGQYVNPQSTPAGVLAGQTLALVLNLNFNWDGCGYHLEELVVAEGPCQEKSVSELLQDTNYALSGNQVSLSYSQLNDCLTKVNENFHEGLEDKGYLKLP